MFKRLSEIFRMEEFVRTRESAWTPGSAGVKIEDGTFSWDFKIKENQDTKKAVKLKFEKHSTPTL